MQAIAYIDRPTGERRTEHPPGEGFLKFLYHHPLGELALQALVKRKLLTTVYARRMHARASRQQIEPFIDTYGVDPTEFLDPVERFGSFNDFFVRQLKPEARPIQAGLVSPADGKVLAFSTVRALNAFCVKGQRFTLERFLQDPALAQQHRHSALLIIRLAPPDYHRFHFPYSGEASAPRAIAGRYFSVSPYATRPNFGRVFTENKRSYTVLHTPDRGDIVLAPVGATMVGSIVHTYSPARPVEKGAEMGYFAFGGSCIIMLVEAGRFEIASDLQANTEQGLETTVKMGEQIGR